MTAVTVFSRRRPLPLRQLPAVLFTSAGQRRSTPTAGSPPAGGYTNSFPPLGSASSARRCHDTSDYRFVPVSGYYCRVTVYAIICEKTRRFPPLAALGRQERTPTQAPLGNIRFEALLQVLVCKRVSHTNPQREQGVHALPRQRCGSVRRLLRLREVQTQQVVFMGLAAQRVIHLARHAQVQPLA